MLEDKTKIENFYREKFYFSYSSIRKLRYSPAAFAKHYIFREREDSVDAHLIAGKVLHCLLLEPENYSKYFVDFPSKLPTGSNKDVIDDIYKKYKASMAESYFLPEMNDLSEVSNNLILDVLKERNLYQSLKTDDQRVNKIVNEINSSYWSFLINSGSKIIVDPAVKEVCIKGIEVIKSDSTVRALMQMDDDSCEKYFEQDCQCELEGKSFGLKGVIDNIVFDKDSNTIFINDLKTTGKPVQNFPDSVEFYEYWIQAVVYKLLVENTFSEKIDKDTKIIVTFIVIDKYNQCYPFQVSEETMSLWEHKFKNDILKEVEYHYDSKDYTLPYDLALGNVKL